MKRKMLSIIVLTMIVGCASAQKKWTYQLGVGGTYNSGNVNNIGFRHNGSAERNDSILSFSGDYKFMYSEEAHKPTNREFTAGIKFDLFQYDRFSPFFASNFITNHFKGYDAKTNVMAGAKLRLYTVPGVCDYSISAAFVYDFVKYTVQEDGLKDQLGRISLRAKIKHKFGDVVTLNHTTFYQPSVTTGFSDYIVTSSTKFENKIGTNFFLDLIFTYECRSVVPTGTKREDTYAEVGLRWKF